MAGAKRAQHGQACANEMEGSFTVRRMGTVFSKIAHRDFISKWRVVRRPRPLGRRVTYGSLL
jgi:hypothetical protein